MRRELRAILRDPDGIVILVGLFCLYGVLIMQIIGALPNGTTP